MKLKKQNFFCKKIYYDLNLKLYQAKNFYKKKKQNFSIFKSYIYKIYKQN